MKLSVLALALCCGLPAIPSIAQTGKGDFPIVVTQKIIEPVMDDIDADLPPEVVASHNNPKLQCSISESISVPVNNLRSGLPVNNIFYEGGHIFLGHGLPSNWSLQPTWGSSSDSTNPEPDYPMQVWAQGKIDLSEEEEQVLVAQYIEQQTKYYQYQADKSFTTSVGKSFYIEVKSGKITTEIKIESELYPNEGLLAVMTNLNLDFSHFERDVNGFFGRGFVSYNKGRLVLSFRGSMENLPDLVDLTVLSEGDVFVGTCTRTP